jgi:hypothetical protein
MVGQVIQIAGSLLILIAFVAAQLRRLDTRAWLYLVLNLVGSATLAVLAFLGRQWGFFLLEGAWAVVSAIGIIHKTRAARPDARPPESR